MFYAALARSSSFAVFLSPGQRQSGLWGKSRSFAYQPARGPVLWPAVLTLSGCSALRSSKAIAIVCCAILSSGVLAGCGQSTSSAPAIEVQGHVLSQGEVAHWMSVVAKRDYELLPRGPVPAWAVPVPPDYTACAEHLRTSRSRPRSTSTVPAKTQCERQYQALRDQVLYSLTTAEWLISEGERLGFKLTRAEIQKHFETVKKNLFPSEAAFRRYLLYTGETVRDQLFRAEIKLYQAKMEARELQELKTGKVSEQTLNRRAEEFPKRWAAHTSCQPGYVLPNCKEYRGHTAPRVELL